MLSLRNLGIISFMVVSVLNPPLGAAPEPPELKSGDGVVPTAYKLHLNIEPDSDEFSGEATISVTLKEERSIIWLNARDLEVHTAAIQIGQEVIPAEVLEGGDEWIGLQIGSALPPGDIVLRLGYKGNLRQDEVAGLFRRQVADDWYVLSQMEPLDARRVFPGFDEPGYKVPFTVSVTTANGDLAFFNTPATEVVENTDGTTTFQFQQTRPLPTYLLAFGVGPFEVVDAGTAGRNKTKVRIIVPRGKAAHARYAASVTGPILELLEEYFDMAYPYEKLDQIAVPNVSFAMEHPGLVSYAQQWILRDPDEDSIPRQRGFASVCAHELAHMWFGDLVTMQWWDDLWLNESFATWMQARIIHRLQPDWDQDVQVVQRRNGALGADSLRSARQIRQPIEVVDDVGAAFDGITYAKGASVLNMFEGHIGESAFRQGVRAYIRRHADGNATAADFMGALEKAAGGEVTRALTTFLNQNGAPQIAMEMNCPAEGRPSLSLRQQRYLPQGSTAGPPQKWRVPVCVIHGAGEKRVRQCMLLTDSQATMELEAESCPDWFIPNADYAGYYRSQVPIETLDALFEDGGERLSVPEQVGLLADMRAMVLAGYLTHGEVMSRLPQLLAMDNRHVLAGATGVAQGAKDIVPDELKDIYASFIGDLFGRQARSLGWVPAAEEDDDTRLLRPALVGLVALTGKDPHLIAAAKRLAGNWMEDRSAVDPQLVGLVLQVAARNGDEAFWNQLYAQAQENKDERTRGLLIGAMGNFMERSLVEKNLAIVLTDEFELFEVGGLAVGALGEEEHRAFTYQWMKSNFERLMERLPQSAQSTLPSLAGSLCDADSAKDAEAFFTPRLDRIEGGRRALDSTLEQIRLCTVYRAAQRPGIIAFLNEYSSPPG
jgi:alanyl aminopeptidase